MKRGSQSDNGVARRLIARVAIVVLVAAQLLAAAHFHQSSAISEFAAASSDVVCAVCAVRVHAPAASIGGCAPYVPALVRAAAVLTVCAGSLAPRVLRLSGRAPPVSL